MTETLLIVAVILLVVVIVAQVALFFRKVQIDLSSVQQAFQAEEKAVRGEIAKNPEELANALKGMADNFSKQFSTLIQDTAVQKTREELVTTLKGVADSVNKQLATLTEANDQKLGAVRDTVEKRLDTLQEENGKKLDQIRQESTAAAQKMREEVKNVVEDFTRNALAALVEQFRIAFNETQRKEFLNTCRAEPQSKGSLRPAEGKQPFAKTRNTTKARVKELGGRIQIDKHHPERPIIGVDFGNTKVTDNDLERLNKDLPDLQSLVLQNTNITTAGLAHINGSPNLKKLDLGNTLVTDAVWEYISGSTQLQWLSLWNTQVSDSGLRHIRRLTNLTFLDLANTKVTDLGLESLKSVNTLDTLDLEGTAVTDKGIAHLTALHGLRILSLAATQVTNTGMAHVKALINLRTLDLTSTRTGDEGLFLLSKLPNLSVLNLRQTQVTDTGVRHLRAMSALQRLRLTGTSVTMEGIKSIEQVLPNCRISLADTASSKQSHTKHSYHRSCADSENKALSPAADTKDKTASRVGPPATRQVTHAPSEEEKMRLVRLATPRAFHCSCCGIMKKSDVIAVVNGDWDHKLCSRCYEKKSGGK